MSTLQDRVMELLQQRDAIDEELEQLRGEFENEIARMQELIARMGGGETAVHIPKSRLVEMRAAVQAKEHNPISETDAGMGVDEDLQSEKPNASFVNELHQLRARNMARRGRA